MTWNKTQDWFWEGNIQNKIADYMQNKEGVKIPKNIKGEESKQIWLYGRHASDHLPITILLWNDRDSDNF